MYSKILVLYDLSEPSQKALRLGLHFKDPSLKQITVLHVIPQDERLTAYGILLPLPEVEKRIHQSIRENIRDLSPANQEKIQQEVNIQVEWSEPIPFILNEIYQNSPDLVIMGTHGRSGIKHILLGSVTEKIIRHSPVPVLAVRNANSWPPKKILLPVEFTEEEEEALLKSVDFCHSFGSELHLVHVISLPDLAGIFPEVSHSKSTDLIAVEEIKRKVHDRLAELAQRYQGISVQTHVRLGVIADEICKLSQEEKLDLIFMPTHGRSGLKHFFIGSEAELVIRHALNNVLTYSVGKTAWQRREHLKKILQ